MRQKDYENLGLGRVIYAAPEAGLRYKLTVQSTGGAKMSMSTMVGSVVQHTTQLLGNGESDILVWPDKGTAFYTAEKPAGGACQPQGQLHRAAARPVNP